METSENTDYIMDPEKLEIVRDTWESLKDRKIEVSQEHYKLLFTEHPEIAPLFTTEQELQSIRFTDSLDYIIGHFLDTSQKEEIVHYYKMKGFKHKAFKVRKKHYPFVVDALKRAIANVMGETYTPEVREAWEQFIQTIGDIMLNGSRQQYLPKLKKKKTA